VCDSDGLSAADQLEVIEEDENVPSTTTRTGRVMITTLC